MTRTSRIQNLIASRIPSTPSREEAALWANDARDLMAEVLTMEADNHLDLCQIRWTAAEASDIDVLRIHWPLFVRDASRLNLALAATTLQAELV